MAEEKDLTTHGEIVSWPKGEYELGAGHAKAMADVIVHGSEFEQEHRTGTYRNASGTLRLEGKDT